MHGSMRIVPALFLMLVFLSCSTGAPGVPPLFDHVVIVIEENKDASQVMGAPYISALAAQGVVFTQMFALTHPSQPNYIGLFSGSFQGVADDAQYDLTAPNLATSLFARGLTFTSYSEGLPVDGSTVFTFGRYARKHNPGASFTNVPPAWNLTLARFPSSYSSLPTVSYVIPNLDNDMHDGSVLTGDAWLRGHLDGYVQWARTHNSLFILTFDEPDVTHAVDTSPIATLIVGANVRPGACATRLTLYSLLRLIEDMYRLPYLGEDASAPTIPAGVWE